MKILAMGQGHLRMSLLHFYGLVVEDSLSEIPQYYGTQLIHIDVEDIKLKPKIMLQLL